MQVRRRTAPPPGVEKEVYFPPAMRPPIGARRLALRYYVNRFPTLNTLQAMKNTETGADGHQVGADSAESKRRGGGPGPKAHDQIEVYEERRVNGE
jgi:hypothetical protein